MMKSYFFDQLCYFTVWIGGNKYIGFVQKMSQAVIEI